MRQILNINQSFADENRPGDIVQPTSLNRIIRHPLFQKGVIEP
jgi:hypothetical protein